MSGPPLDEKNTLTVAHLKDAMKLMDAVGVPDAPVMPPPRKSAGVLHLNRCKNCRAWRGPKRHHACNMRLRETLDVNGDVTHVRMVCDPANIPAKTEPSPMFGLKTKPGDCCKHFWQKPPTYRTPAPEPERASLTAVQERAIASLIAGVR